MSISEERFRLEKVRRDAQELVNKIDAAIVADEEGSEREQATANVLVVAQAFLVNDSIGKIADGIKSPDA